MEAPRGYDNATRAECDAWIEKLAPVARKTALPSQTARVIFTAQSKTSLKKKWLA